MYVPFRIRVARTERISPNFQRITFHGVDLMGPQKVVRDLRIKLIFPGSNGLPPITPDDNWRESWLSLPDDTRGTMRTYSVRALRRPTLSPSNASPTAAELDIDFVIHAEAPGPASTWAASASEGDELILLAPTRDDNSGVGIEFTPGAAKFVRMFGDETALPAIAKTLEEWPDGISGSVFIEVPCAADIQEISVPEGVNVQWLPREDGEQTNCENGDLLQQALENLGSEQGLNSVDGAVENNQRPSDISEDRLIWETPMFSSGGEDVEKQAPGEGDEQHNTYYWIAGEAGAVVAMRRLLVRGWGIPRGQVSFMGYWKRGTSARG